MEYRQDPIPRSQYQTGMDESDDDYDVGENETCDTEIRYWSDFNRVSYNPRTMQQIPDPADWENVDGEWNLGQQSFIRYNGVRIGCTDEICNTNPMKGHWFDGRTRATIPRGMWFASGVLSLSVATQRTKRRSQGIQVMNDTASFGSFISSFLISFHDEYLKLPSLIFPLLSDVVPRHIDVDDVSGPLKCLPCNPLIVSETRRQESSKRRSISEKSEWAILYEYPHSIPIYVAK